MEPIEIIHTYARYHVLDTYAPNAHIVRYLRTWYPGPDVHIPDATY